MANQEQLEKLRAGATIWNRWRAENPEVIPSLMNASLQNAKLSGAHLHEADLTGADLIGADLTDAGLTDAYVQMADLRKADLSRARMSAIDLGGAMLNHATLRDAQLPHAYMAGADLYCADLRNADLTDADLSYVQLAEARVEGTTLTRARVYGISAWGLEGEPKDQTQLIITPYGESPVRVDEIEMAQFVYLVLNNANITKAFDTLTGKAVLILGRFADGGQEILTAIHRWLRSAGYVPIIFTFEKPKARDFMETVRTLVGLSRFVIADIGKPRSVQQELQATVPDFEVPFAPIMNVRDEPWSMFQDIERKKWVLPHVSYSDENHLLKNLDRLVKRLEALQQQVVAEKSRASQGPTPIDQM